VSAKPRAAISWSGGKDSCAALHRAYGDYDVVCMLTMFDETAERSRSHGLRPEVLAAQAARLGLLPFTGRCTWETYDAVYSATLAQVKADAGITHVIFGDILFDEHRLWAERMCAGAGLVAVEPLFGSSTLTLFEEWTASGADAVIVTVRAEVLDETWLGRPLRRPMLDAFTRLGVDPCGERGEYHTVVTNCALFSEPLLLETGRQVQRAGCWALDVNIADCGLRIEDSERPEPGIAG
jgi:diphthine-ammonia ligase